MWLLDYQSEIVWVVIVGLEWLLEIVVIYYCLFIIADLLGWLLGWLFVRFVEVVLVVLLLLLRYAFYCIVVLMLLIVWWWRDTVVDWLLLW